MKSIFKWFKETFGDTWLAKAVEKLFFSFDNDNKGLSGKKLTAFTLTYCVIRMHEYWIQYAFIWKDFSLFPVILGADFGFLLALFGINEYDKNRKAKSGAKATTETSSTTTETTETTETSQPNPEV